MVRAAVSGYIKYSEFDPKKAVSYIQERILLEEMENSLYTTILQTLVLSGESERWTRFVKNIFPWMRESMGDMDGEKLQRIRAEQYKFPEFRQKVEELMRQGAERETAELFAEFWMLKKQSMEKIG